MAAKAVSIDVTECREFFEQMGKASTELKKEMETWLDAVGNEFLRVVQDEIIDNAKATDTRLLLSSFSKGDKNNVWEATEGGLTLEVGTIVDYASYVNDGHYMNPKGTDMRFVPGDVKTDERGKVISFRYNPNAKGGITLKQKWIEGSHYFDNALRIIDRMLPWLLDVKMEQWLKKYF